MEESRLLGLLQRHDPDMRFEVQLRKPIPASRVPADRRRYVTFVFAVKVGDQEVMVIEERYASSPYSASPGARLTGRLLPARRYSRARRYHWRLVQLGLVLLLDLRWVLQVLRFLSSVRNLMREPKPKLLKNLLFLL